MVKTVRQKLGDCLGVTKKCLEKVKVKNKKGAILLKFAADYYEDAAYYEKRDPATALEAVAYAHGFIDAGVLLGLLEIRGHHLSKRSATK